MNVVDPTILNAAGDPASALAPVVLVVMEGELTDELLAEVQKVYQQFCTQKRLSVAPHALAEKNLAAGGRVRMESLLGRDIVRVWVADAEQDVTLRHGIVVVSPWSTPCFYGRTTSSWEALSLPVPQETLSTYNLQVCQRDGTTFHLPTTLTQELKVWDWAEHDGPLWSATDVVPVVAAPPNGVDVGDWHAPHYGVGGEIRAADGTTLFASAEMPPINLVEPEVVHWAPPATDLLGQFVLLQHRRSAVLSTTSNIWKHKYCMEKVRRLDESQYVSDARTETEVITPFAETTVNQLQVSDGDLGAEPDLNALTLTALDFDFSLPADPSGNNGVVTGSGWFDPPGINEYYATGLRLYEHSNAARALAVRSTQALREVVRQAPGTTQTAVVAVVGADAPRNVTVKSNLNFIRSITWRAGSDSKAYDWSSNNFGGDKWGCVKVENVRRDLSYELGGTPNIEFDLGFVSNFRAFEGSLNGVMRGKEYYDERTLVGLFSRFREFTILRLSPWFTSPGAPDAWYLLQAENWKSQYVALNNQFAAGQWFSSVVERTAVVSEEPQNTGDYSYTSRYIIDFDPKTAFYLAIKVEVQCTGALWTHRPDLGYRGLMEKAADPSYTVIISVVTSWRGQTEEVKELVRSSASRPPFEFSPVQMVNPFYWPAPVANGREVLVYLPPAVRPDERMLTQLDNIIRHQGVNKRIAGDASFAGAAALPAEAADLWVDEVPTTVSKIEAGEERPNAQMPLGMVYARAIKLSDFPDAFWLLAATRCDAELGGAQPVSGPPRPKWYYMPDIGDAINNESFRVEVRDGKFVDWTDDIVAKEGSTRPEPIDRNIEVYVV